MTNPTNQLLIGDALDTLRTLPPGSIDMCLTSPPYFRLRDYDASGQLGLEESVDAWAHNIRQITQDRHTLAEPGRHLRHPSAPGRTAQKPGFGSRARRTAPARRWLDPA